MPRRRWVYYIPRLKKLTGGQKDHWMKLYVDKLLASLRFKKLSLSEKGFYMHCVLIADKNGELRTGSVIFTAKDLMKELHTDKQTFLRISRRLMRKSCQLLARKPIEFPENSHRIPGKDADIPRTYDDETPHNKNKSKNKNKIKNKDMSSPKKEPPVSPKEALSKKTNPDVKKFLDYAFDTYKAKFNKRLVIVGGRDGKIVKGLLETGREPFTLEELKALWNDFLDSDIKTKEGSVTHSIPAFKGFLQTVIEGGGTIDKEALQRARIIRVAKEQGEGETWKECFQRLLRAGLVKAEAYDPTGRTMIIAALKQWGVSKK